MSTLQSPPIPYKKIMTSLPFYAILLAHMGQNYGYETLMTELPTYMKQVLRFSIKEVSLTASPIIPSRVVSNESLSRRTEPCLRCPTWPCGSSRCSSL